jgi:hypothetical protein
MKYFAKVCTQKQQTGILTIESNNKKQLYKDIKAAAFEYYNTNKEECVYLVAKSSNERKCLFCGYIKNGVNDTLIYNGKITINGK